MRSSDPKKREPKRPVTDQEMIEVALERFEPLSRSEPLKQIRQIAKEHGRKESVISNAINRAFARKLVGIVPLKHPGPARILELEQKLLDRFDKLHEARVIKASAELSASTSERAISEDNVHLELGTAAASLIAQKLIIRDKDVIGIGSGRGVYAVVEALSYFDTLRAHNVTAVSLTGDVYPHSHAYWSHEVNARTPGLNRTLDADDHVNFLGLRFPSDLKMIKMSSVIAWERGGLTAARKRTILDRDAWKTMVPNLAIVGVGVFSRGHRFFQEVNAPPNLRERRLEPILADLRALASKVSETIEPSDAERYVPVADVCNRLFYVTPPQGIKISAEKQTQIKALIQSINEKLLCPSEEQLAEIKQLILVAGTLKKAQAIKQLLEEDKYKIRILCVDQEAAQAILAN